MLCCTSVLCQTTSTLRIIVLSSQYIQLSTTQLSKEEDNKAFLKKLLLQNNTYYTIKCPPIHFLPQIHQEQVMLSKTPGFLLIVDTVLAHMTFPAGHYQSSLQVKNLITFYTEKGSLPCKLRTAPLLENNVFSADLCSG